MANHPGVSPLVRNRLAQINASTKGTLALGMFATVGRSLVAGRHIGCGEVVLQDTPIATFHQPLGGGINNVETYSSSLDSKDEQRIQNTNMDEWSKKLALCCDAAHQFLTGQPVPREHVTVTPTTTTKAGVPEYLQAAARALWPLVQAALLGQSTSPTSSEDSQPSLAARGIALLDMHVPELPINAEVTRLYRYCESVVGQTNGDDDNEEAVTALLHAVMAAKVNSHRSADGTHWCLYPIASKLAHTCDPNLFYVPTKMSSATSADNDEDANPRGYGARFVATRDIAVGELLSFSYLGGDLLVGPAEPRQARLAASHRFVCACSRCSSMDTFTSEIITSNSTLGLALLPPSSVDSYIIRRTSKRLQTDQDVTMHNLNLSQDHQKDGVWCVVESSRMNLVDRATSITDTLINMALTTTPITKNNAPLLSCARMIGDLLKHAEDIVGASRDILLSYTAGGKKTPLLKCLTDCANVLELISSLGSIKTLVIDNIGSRHYLISHILDCQAKLSKLGCTILQQSTSPSTGYSNAVESLHDAILILLSDTNTDHARRVDTQRHLNTAGPDGDSSEAEEEDGCCNTSGVTAALSTCKELLVRLHGRYAMNYIVWTSLTADLGSTLVQGRDRVVGVSLHQVFPTCMQYVVSSSKSEHEPAMTYRCVSLPHMVAIQTLRSWCENVITTAKPKLAALIMKQMMLKNAQRNSAEDLHHKGNPAFDFPSCILHFRQTSSSSSGLPVLGEYLWIAEDATEVPPFDEEYNINLRWVDSGIVVSQELLGVTFPTEGPAAEVRTLFPCHKDLYNLVMACLVGNLIVAPALGVLTQSGVSDSPVLSSTSFGGTGGGLSAFSKNLALITKCLLGGHIQGSAEELSQDSAKLLIPEHTNNLEYKSLSEVLLNTNCHFVHSGSPGTETGSTIPPKDVVIQVRRPACM